MVSIQERFLIKRRLCHIDCPELPKFSYTLFNQYNPNVCIACIVYTLISSIPFSDPYQLHNVAFEEANLWIDDDTKQVLLGRIDELSNCYGTNDCNLPMFEPSKKLKIPSRGQE